ncbi:hypothetical protein NHX12_000882 [Muraenolepis orangiensis]|uniref:Uncharacterized protein n=1 Tax=Muraenolepis orangiensis TaxID=630683 RepID=A0A9Q0IG41_9TELE|nr:hypothetical protein NHX12_000882 [Muraenolepis orangiensis]
MGLKQPGHLRGHKTTVVFFALMVTLTGADGLLEVSPVGPSRVNALAGSRVTLSVSFSGAPDPVVLWSIGSLPVVTWTIGSADRPDVADAHADVLELEEDGSLSLVGVPLSYSHNYTVEITKSGLGVARTHFILKVYEHLQNASITPDPALAVEGLVVFSLRSSVQRGEVERRRWFLEGAEIRSNSSHYSLREEQLLIRQLRRGDAGRYSLQLLNALSEVEVHFNLTVLSQGGNYTCQLRNEKSGARRTVSISVPIYDRPLGDPACSVLATTNNDLQYRCQWPGGVPKPSLAFLSLSSNASAAAGDLHLTLAPSEDLDWKTVVCRGQHPLLTSSCNVTARQPVEFLPRVGVGVGSDGRMAVTIACVSHAVPDAVVTWLREGGQAVTSGNQHQISANTTLLTVRHFNVSEFLRDRFTCTCANPLGHKARTTRLLGPSISESSLLPNLEGTAVTLTWEVPPLSLVTGFDIQMRGPALDPTIGRSSEFRSLEFRSIQVKPGSARSAGILNLDPKSTYHFRVVPSAGRTVGEPSKQQRIGPGTGLSGAAIAGIAAGIPCSILALFTFTALLYLSVSYCKNTALYSSLYPFTHPSNPLLIPLALYSSL